MQHSIKHSQLFGPLLRKACINNSPFSKACTQVLQLRTLYRRSNGEQMKGLKIKNTKVHPEGSK